MFLLGCSRIQEGEVYSKDFYKAYDEEVYSPIIVGDISIPNWTTVHHNARWSVDIRNNYDEVDDNWQTRRVFVSKGTWDSYTIGDWLALN